MKISKYSTMAAGAAKAASALVLGATCLAFTVGPSVAQPNGATLIVSHEAIPDDIADFTYTVSGQTSVGAMLDDDATATNGDNNLGKSKTSSVIPGDYTITQQNPGPGWVLSAINCDGPTPAYPNLANRTVSLNVATGTNITCKFINTKTASPPTGTIRINKQASPDDPQDFNFTGSGPNGFSQNFTLDQDDSLTNPSSTPYWRKFENLPVGTYNFAEAFSQAPPIWRFTGLVCWDVNSSTPNTPANNVVYNLATYSVQINLSAGQNIMCDFINQRADHKIRITKIASPAGPEVFTFSGTGQNFSTNFVLDDNNIGPNPNFKVIDVPTGTFVFTETTLPLGWTLTNLTCQTSANASAAINLATRKVTINVSGGSPYTPQTISCTYRNKGPILPPCTGYPMNAVVNLHSGPNYPIVNICRGGTVTFSKTLGGAFMVTPTIPPASFPAIPLAAGISSGTTIPFASAGLYKYQTIPVVPQGTIIVHN